MSAAARIAQFDPTKRAAVGGSELVVDFAPATLRLSHSVVGPAGTLGGGAGATERTSTPSQQTGHRTTLSMDLLFDTTRDGGDVRQRTLRLVALTRAPATPGPATQVEFSWGSFRFVGEIESLGETIDLFSPDGIPLRATVAATLREVGERERRPADRPAGAGASASPGASASFGASAPSGASAPFGASASAAASFGAAASLGGSASLGASLNAAATAAGAVGTSALTVVTAGDTLQSLAARAGVSWKAVAAANGVTNPRLLPPGTVLDLRVGR